MPTNKHAALRYRCLDELLQEQNHPYTAAQLRRKCAEYVTDRTGAFFIDDEIPLRTFREDIKNMRENYNAPIIYERYDGENHFRYEDPAFSIYNSNLLTASESHLLLDTINMLGRLKGMPQFDELATMAEKLGNNFGIENDKTSVVGFDQLRYMAWQDYFIPLFQAITSKQVMSIEYKPFDKPKMKYTFSPYYLKQFNQRWYVLGQSVEEPEIGPVKRLALDRIQKMPKAAKGKFIENPGIDFDEYFEDIIGVTILDSKVEKVKMKVDPKYMGYFSSKPMHHSLRIKPDGIATIDVRINRELENKLLEMSSEVEVLEPLSLRKTIHDRLVKALSMHQLE